MSIRVSIVMRMTLSLHVISHLVQSRAAALFGKALIDRLMCWHGRRHGWIPQNFFKKYYYIYMYTNFNNFILKNYTFAPLKI